MRAFVYALPLLALAGCGDTLASLQANVEKHTGLTASELQCIFGQVVAMPTTTDRLAAALEIGGACGIDAERIGSVILGKFKSAVEVDDEVVVVDEAANTVTVTE
jgi:hypothetical protein